MEEIKYCVICDKKLRKFKKGDDWALRKMHKKCCKENKFECLFCKCVLYCENDIRDHILSKQHRIKAINYCL